MGTDEPVTDDLGDLVEVARSGDRHAFDEIVRRTYVDVYTLAVRLTGNEEDAGDVTQEAYVRAWRGIGRFRGDAQFSTWMHRITANVAYTHLGRRRRRRTEPLDDVAEPVETRPEALPERSAESSELADRISDALASLPPKLRAVVVLKDVYGLPHDAIAQELRISVAAAKVRLHRGRQQLQSCLNDDREGEERAV
jgi:RNA polymerase sigma-70 factor, ECF subfamily